MSKKTILGKSKAVQDLLRMISKVASSKTNVLVIGESGTGKELVARMIHDSGPLQGKPFIPVNCGAIPETLIESEMFGHRRGSFTGAIGDKAGLFEAANGGTLFLDEVGELPLNMQVKLLRAIQERAFRKVGGVDDIRVDVRIIAATNRDLETAVRQGTFREDLYYRLNVILIRTPPLREREGDTRLLAEHFLAQFNKKFGKDHAGFDPDVLSILERHSWPGNVRELENVIERAVTLETGNRISQNSLPSHLTDPETTTIPDEREELRIPAPDFTAGPINLDQVLGEIERKYLEAALSSAGGVKKKAADLLGITFRSIRYRLKKLGLSDQEEAE